MILYVIIGVLVLLTLGSTIFGMTYFSRYRILKGNNSKLKKTYTALKEEYLFKGRKGFYEHSFCGAKGIVYLQEIERYNNDYSKVRFLNIEIYEGYGDEAKWCRENAEETFTSIRKTSSIEWLEPNIKDQRKEKLKEIEKNLGE